MHTRGSVSNTFPDRRVFLTTSLAAGAAVPLGEWSARAEDTARPKVAAVFTAFTRRSHAHVIMENFLEPYLFNGKLTDPGVDVASFYADQFPEEDMARSVAKDYGVPIFPTIGEALTLSGLRHWMLTKIAALDWPLQLTANGWPPQVGIVL